MKKVFFAKQQELVTEIGDWRDKYEASKVKVERLEEEKKEVTD